MEISHNVNNEEHDESIQYHSPCDSAEHPQNTRKGVKLVNEHN